MSVPIATLISHVLVNGLAVYSSREVIRPEDALVVFDALTLVLDDWSADVQTSVAGVFTPFVTTPSLQPHTIGPTGTWVLPARPVKIDGAALSLGSGVWAPIAVHHDPQWWLAQSLATNATTTSLYYSADVPNGSIYFSGVPTGPLTVEILTRWSVGAAIQTSSLVLPPGYQSALEFTVMERVCDGFHVVLTANQIKLAGLARARIFGNNLRVPSLTTAGLGLPGQRGGQWDYRTGTIR
jgi:hypothetical protein